MPEPPRPVERLLRRLLLRGPGGDALLGDLREEYDHGRRAGLRPPRLAAPDPLSHGLATASR